MFILIFLMFVILIILFYREASKKEDFNNKKLPNKNLVLCFKKKIKKNNILNYKIIDTIETKYEKIIKLKIWVNNKNKKQIELNGDCKGSCVVNLNNVKYNKKEQYELFKKYNIPYPETNYIYENDDKTKIDNLLLNIKYPVVIKPTDGRQGKNVYCNIKNKEELQKKINIFIQKKRFPIIIQTHIFGSEYRILTFNNKILSIYKKCIPTIIGNGKDSIKKLFDDYKLKYNLKNQKIKSEYLKKNNYNLNSILNKGIIFKLLDDSSPLNLAFTDHIKFLSQKDINNIHPDNIELFKKLNLKIGMIYGGIDFRIKDLRESYKKNGGGVIETNEQPCLSRYPPYYWSYILKLWSDNEFLKFNGLNK